MTIIHSSYLPLKTTLPSTYFINNHKKVFHFETKKQLNILIRANENLDVLEKTLSDKFNIPSQLAFEKRVLGPTYWSSEVKKITSDPNMMEIYLFLTPSPIHAMERLVFEYSETCKLWKQKWKTLMDKLNDSLYHNCSENINQLDIPSLDFLFVIFYEVGLINNNSDDVDNFIETWQVNDMLEAILKKNNELVGFYENEIYNISFRCINLFVYPLVNIVISNLSSQTVKERCSILKTFETGPLTLWEKKFGDNITNAMLYLNKDMYSNKDIHPINIKLSIQDYFKMYNEKKTDKLELFIVLNSC